MEKDKSTSEAPSHRPELPLSTKKALYSTLPFDSGQAILFQKAVGTEHDFLVQPKNSSGAVFETDISGEEAKQFYEEVTSLPTERPKRKVAQKRQYPHENTSALEHKIPTRHVKKKVKLNVSHVFHYAQNGDLNALDSVLSQDLIDINIVDHFGWTLLMCASHAGHTDTVEHLLSNGAEWKECVDKRGNNALDLARIAGHLHIVDLIERFSHLHVQSEEDSSDVKPSDLKSEQRKSRRRSRTMDSESSSKRKKRKTSTYFCEICKLNLSSDVAHSTSTIHQFSCQHHPKVHSYGISHTNRGYQMLLREGWDPDRGLGVDKQGQQYPVKTVLKQDKLGFGVASGKGPRVTHFSAHDRDAVKYPRERGIRGSESVRNHRTKKDIVRAIEKERRWEINMRRYMNTDLDF